MALTDNLVAYFPFDGDYVDAVGAFDGTPVNSPTFTTGKIGQGVDLELSLSQYVDHGNGMPIDNVAAFSMSLWVNLESVSSFQNFVSKYAASTSRVAIGLGGGGVGSANEVAVFIANGTSAFGRTSTAPVVTGNWMYVVAVYDGSLSGNENVLKLYIQGTQLTLTFSGTIPLTTPNNTSTPFRVSEAAGFFLDGMIDELGIWTRALTGAEVIQLFNGGAGLAYPFTSSTPRLSFTNNAILAGA